MHHLTSIFLTLLFFLIGGNPAVAKNQVSSALLGDLCGLAVNSSSTRTTTGPVATIIPNQTQAFTVNDRLTTDTYDSNGNTLRSADTLSASSSSSTLPPPSYVTDVYSFDNRLIRRTTPDGKVIDLTYNPDGHRLTKYITQNALTQRLVHYLTDANNPTGYAQVIEEKHPLDTANPLKKVNLYGHDLICSVGLQPSSSSPLTPPTSLLYYNYDGLGSVRGITNATGDLQEAYDYDAYGTLIGLAKRNSSTGVLESGDLTNPANKPTSEFLFTGEQWDADLGMVFLRARYLNTNTGRFHTQDSYEGRTGEPLTLHKYLYANGSPAMFTDPSGRFSLTEQSLVNGLISIALPTMTTSSLATRFLLSQIQIAISLTYINRYYPAMISATRSQSNKFENSVTKIAFNKAADFLQNKMIESMKKASLGTLTIHLGAIVNLTLLARSVYIINQDIVKGLDMISRISGGRVTGEVDRAGSIISTLIFSASPDLVIDAIGNIAAARERREQGMKKLIIDDINSTIIRFELSNFRNLGILISVMTNNHSYIFYQKSWITLLLTLLWILPISIVTILNRFDLLEFFMTISSSMVLAYFFFVRFSGKFCSFVSRSPQSINELKQSVVFPFFVLLSLIIVFIILKTFGVSIS